MDKEKTVIFLAAGGPAPDEIFSALNSDDGFDSVMHDYIYEAAKHRE